MDHHSPTNHNPGPVFAKSIRASQLGGFSRQISNQRKSTGSFFFWIHGKRASLCHYGEDLVAYLYCDFDFRKVNKRKASKFAPIRVPHPTFGPASAVTYSLTSILYPMPGFRSLLAAWQRSYRLYWGVLASPFRCVNSLSHSSHLQSLSFYRFRQVCSLLPPISGIYHSMIPHHILVHVFWNRV